MEKRFVELVEYSITSRGRIIDVGFYEQKRRDYEAYTSLFSFEEEVVDYVKNNLSLKTKLPSIENYIGRCSSKFLWIDVDVEGNMPAATKSMLDIVARLDNEYAIPYKSLLVFFSGNKGYHIGIPTKSFGAEEYWSDILPQVFKLMVKIITDKIPYVDTVIYNTSRLFRCPYSKHPKTLKYKIPVSIPRILADGYEDVLMCADFCNRHCDYTMSIAYSDKLKKLFDNCVTQCTNSADVFVDNDGYDANLSVKENRSIFRLPNKGERNDLIYKMAYRLFSIKGLKVNEISDIMKFVYDIVNEHSNKAGGDRYSEMEFKVSMNSAYSRTRLRAVQNVKAKSFDALAKLMYDKIKNAKHSKTIIDVITEDLKGGWMIGNTYALIGKGGTMKSYYLQEELVSKALEEKKDSLFVNLEMSDTTLYDRVWMALFSKSMSDMIISGQLNDFNLIEMQELASSMIGNYLHVFSGVDIEPEDLEGIIKSKEDEIKRKISLVGVDSVGGMKLYNDSEAMTALKLSKGLKESAKNTSTAIITINHARNDCPITMRDCSSYVRGGSKFVDNCDAYISLSSVVSVEESNLERTPPDIVYSKGLKYLRFVNKRGSGNTINKIIKFSPEGRTIVLNDSPSSYDVDIPKVGFYS